MTFWKRKAPAVCPDQSAAARYSATRMLKDALADRHISFDAKAAIVLDWLHTDATDAQATDIGNRAGRMPQERARA